MGLSVPNAEMSDSTKYIIVQENRYTAIDILGKYIYSFFLIIGTPPNQKRNNRVIIFKPLIRLNNQQTHYYLTNKLI